MKAADKANKPCAPGVIAGQLDRRFDRLRPRVTEKDMGILIKGRDFIQRFTERHPPFMVKVGGDM